MKIGIDFDDVLLDCNTALAAFHNARYGTSYKREDVRSWDLSRMWNCTKEEEFVRVREWWASQDHFEAPLVPGALTAVEILAMHHELHIITARQVETSTATKAWLARHFPSHFNEVHFVSKSDTDTGSKVEACQQVGIDLMIDDSLSNACNLNAAGIQVLLFDAPWNQEEVPPSIVRVYNWEQALYYLGHSSSPPAS